MKSLTVWYYHYHCPPPGPLQFAYRINRLVGDAVNMALHLDSAGIYARLLFVDFGCAFNIFIPTLLQEKLSQLNVSASTCRSIIDFLSFIASALVPLRALSLPL